MCAGSGLSSMCASICRIAGAGTDVASSTPPSRALISPGQPRRSSTNRRPSSGPPSPRIYATRPADAGTCIRPGTPSPEPRLLVAFVVPVVDRGQQRAELEFDQIERGRGVFQRGGQQFGMLGGGLLHLTETAVQLGDGRV